MLLHPSLILPPHLSPLPPYYADLLSLLFASSYVGAIYIARLVRSRRRSVKDDKTEATRSRDHPETIKSRMRAVGLVSGLSVGVMLGVVLQQGGKVRVASLSHLDKLTSRCARL